MRGNAVRPGWPGGHLVWLAAVAMATAASPALAAKALGIDVAQFQGVIDWNQVLAGGYTFAFVRESHGSLQDLNYSDNILNARDAGVIVGPYYYAVPVYDADYDMVGMTPQAAATQFLTRARGHMTLGYLRPMLDIEEGGNATPVGAPDLSTWANTWMSIIERETGVEPMVYCNTNYARNYLSDGNPSLNTKPLVLANWAHPSDPANASPPANSTGIWSTWTFWQHCSYGNTAGHPSVPGVPARVDLDVFNGTVSQLQNYVIRKWAVLSPSPTTLATSVRQRLSPANQSFTLRNTGTAGMIYKLQSNRTWLTLSPTSEFLRTGTATITLSYATADLPVGTHSATVYLYADLASNSPVTVQVTLTVKPIPGDLNHDGNIDSSDVTVFLGCLTGAHQGPPTAGCEEADIEGDNDVDQSDFARLQTCMSGTGVAADPACAP